MEQQSKFETVVSQLNLEKVIQDLSGIHASTKPGTCPLCGHHDCFHLLASDKSNRTNLNLFKCFSCGETGNVVQFVTKYKKFSDNDYTCDELIDTYGIDYKDDTPVDPEYKAYVSFCSTLSYIFTNEYIKAGLTYFEDRGISREVIDKYALGYCPEMLTYKEKDGSESSIDYWSLLCKLSPVIPQGFFGSNHEFLFKNRLIIPIRDFKGNIVGFGGRSLDPKAPKYVNTGENKFFNKSKLLFNLNVARGYPSVIVVEGYMDALSLITTGTMNVVATMGTAVSNYHLAVFKNKKIILSLDNDSAGRQATLDLIIKHRDIRFDIVLDYFFKDFNEALMNGFKPKDIIYTERGPLFLLRHFHENNMFSNVEIRDEIYRTFARLIGADHKLYLKEFPINTIYTPVELDYFWKKFHRAYKKIGVVREGQYNIGGR